MNNSINILILGQFYSGSSAILDFLRNYSSIGYIEGEFDEFRRSQMLGDYLTNRIGNDYPNSSIPRYISSKRHHSLYRFIDLNLDWKADEKLNFNDIERFSMLLTTDKKLKETKCLFTRMQLAKEYLHSIKKIYTPKNKFTLFDQPLFFGCHEEVWQEFFEPFKLIIVRRDIKDQIADLIKNKVLFMDRETPTRSMFLKYGDGKLGAIKYEVDMIKERRKHSLELSKANPKNILYISFEDFIYQHSSTKKMIEKFLNLSPKNYNPNDKNFNLQKSSKNIGINKHYLSTEENNLIDELILS